MSGSTSPLLAYIATDADELHLVATTRGPGIDVAEICGGEARVSQLAVRRRLDAGQNLDLVTHIDLCIRKNEEASIFVEKRLYF